MAGKLRYLLALAFVAVFALVPAPDHEQLAFLDTRSWLLGDDSPLGPLTESGSMPPLAIDVKSGLPGAAGRPDRAADYERIGREYARGHGKQPATTSALALQVRIGDNGFRSTLLAPEQGSWKEVAHHEKLRSGGDSYYPDRWSLLPAFLAIVLAILTGRVIPSLLLGCLAGATLYARGPLAGAVHLVRDTIFQQTLGHEFNLRIIGFVVLLFMAVGIMARSGGIEGMVEWVRKFARGPVSTQVCSFLIGILIFFDDYSNCIIAGTTMRPLTDRNRVSREKLAYIVDSTAAPVAGISLVSTWIAYEISMFRDQLPEVTKPDGTSYLASEGFSVFVQTLPYRFYCAFTLILVLLTIVLRREFGPMLQAERRAAHHSKPVADDAQPMMSRGFSDLRAPEGAPIRGRNALIPVVLLVGLAIGLMLWIGYDSLDGQPLTGSLLDRIRTLLSNTQSELALLVASAVAAVVAAGLAIGQRILTPRETAASAVGSIATLGFALVIMILAWSIGHTCQDLGTAPFLTAALQGRFVPWVLPMVMFGLAALVSFSTGTSYGTMAILLPNIVVLSHHLGQTDPTLGGTGLMVLTIGAVLEGSIFGDHCSPISDTTVLSSVATASDHLHHVRTQAPYALLAMGVAIVFGYLPMATLSRDLWWLSWLVGTAVMIAWLLIVGRRPAAKSSGSGATG